MSNCVVHKVLSCIHHCHNVSLYFSKYFALFPKSSQPFTSPFPVDDYPNLASPSTPVNQLLKKLTEGARSSCNTPDSTPIPVRITFPGQVTRSTDWRHCLQNCVEICRKKGKVINDIASKSNGIKLVYLNAQSLKNRKHLAQIKELVSDENVDVLAVSGHG